MIISTEFEKLEIVMIHGFLSQQSAWAKGIPLATVERSLRNSLCFGAYLDGIQIGFARVVSDFATFAYLMDVFVLPEHRGQQYSLQLLNAVFEHPQLQGLRRFMLASSDARDLYRRFGFSQVAKPEIFMEINHPNIYQDAK